MLAKLMKWEFRATARAFIPIYAALIVLSLVANLARITATAGGALFAVLLSGLYLLLALGLLVVAVVVILVRFYRSLFTCEGYLPLCLPVRPCSLLLAKMLPALIWLTGCLLLFFTIAGALTGLISGFQNLQQVLLSFRHFFSSAAITPLQSLAAALNVLLSIVTYLLFLYFCLAIGQLFRSYHLLFSFLCYLVLQNVARAFGVQLLVNNGFSLLQHWIYKGLSPLVSAVILLFVCALLFFVICRIIKQRQHLHFS